MRFRKVIALAKSRTQPDYILKAGRIRNLQLVRQRLRATIQSKINSLIGIVKRTLYLSKEDLQ